MSTVLNITLLAVGAAGALAAVASTAWHRHLARKAARAHPSQAAHIQQLATTKPTTDSRAALVHVQSDAVVLDDLQTGRRIRVSMPEVSAAAEGQKPRRHERQLVALSRFVPALEQGLEDLGLRGLWGKPSLVIQSAGSVQLAAGPEAVAGAPQVNRLASDLVVLGDRELTPRQAAQLLRAAAAH